jgi:hypothetical protein
LRASRIHGEVKVGVGCFRVYPDVLLSTIMPCAKKRGKKGLIAVNKKSKTRRMSLKEGKEHSLSWGEGGGRQRELKEGTRDRGLRGVSVRA